MDFKFTAIPMDAKSNPNSHGSVYPILNQPASGQLEDPPSALNPLDFLLQYDALYVHTNAIPLAEEGHGMSALIRNGPGDYVLNVKKIQGTTMNFISGGGHGNWTDPAIEGKIVFKSDRNGQITSVTAGDSVLGDIIWSSRDRSFRILRKAGDPEMELKPNTTTKCLGCYYCNACCIKEYLIYSNGTAIATILQKDYGTGHEVKFQPQVDSNSRALILAAVMMIYEAFFSPQCSGVPVLKFCYGNIGYEGRNWVSLYLILFLIGIIVIILCSTLA